MDKSFITKITKALGYNIVVNDDDPDNPTAVLSPIDTESVPATSAPVANSDDGESQATALLAQNAISEIQSLREQLGGEAGLKDLISTINQAKAIIAQNQASEAVERDGLIAQLVANTSVYTEDELKGMTVPALRKLSRVMALPEVDYSLTTAGVAHNSADKLATPPAVFFAPRGNAQAQ